VLVLAVSEIGVVRAGSPPGNTAQALDRVAVAIDGAESSYGEDPDMWRSDPAGPQGPMQVSAAAAADVGAGDRFDPTENQMLGRAYLARLYRHYANWADAIAAYNWGPGHMDTWIDSGRPIDKFPEAVSLYRLRVLSTADSDGRRFMPSSHLQPRRSAADLRHPSRDSVAVEQLYGAILRGGRP
jgi:Transglycosylase SLT domain